MEGTQPTNETKKKRRSSILKSQRVSRTPFSELEFNVATPPLPDASRARRVSFSRRMGVAEFATNEGTTTWKNFYEEQNKSLESSDHDAGNRQLSVGHIGNRIFDQQFEEVEAEIDYIGTLGVPTSVTHNTTNVTEQLAFLESIDDDDRKLTAPQSNHELSSFTEHSKLFRNNMTNPKINSMSECINFDFSSVNPLGDGVGASDDELDEIERDLKYDPPVVVGPAFDPQKESQYIQVDLNTTQGVRINDSDMSITDTIRSPKKEVSQIAKSSNASTDKNWLEDKENIVVNPYMPPVEDNFTSNDVEKVLVFDGKKVKYVDINADLDKLIDDINDTAKPAKRELVDERKHANKTVIFDENAAEMSLTRLLQCDDKPIITQDFINVTKQTNKTVIFDDRAADMSITRPLQFEKRRITQDFAYETKEANKTVIFDDRAADMSITRPLQFEKRQITQDLAYETKEANNTVIFDDRAADMSITRPLKFEKRQITQDFVNVKETNKTVIFDDRAADMSITRPLKCEKRQITQDFVNVKETNKTVIFDNRTADMSITKPLQCEKRQIKLNFTGDLVQNNTIIYDENVADMSITRPIPHLTAEVRTMLFDNVDVQIPESLPVVAKSNDTVKCRIDDETANMSVTQIIVNDLWRSAAQINRTNKVTHDSKLDDMSFTKIAPTIFLGNVSSDAKTGINEQSEEYRRSDCDSEKQNKQCEMSFTQLHTSSLNLSEMSSKFSQEKYSDMSMTQAVPVSTIQSLTTNLASEASLSIIKNSFQFTTIESVDTETATLVKESVGMVNPSPAYIYPQTTTSECMTVQQKIPTIETLIKNPAVNTKKVYVPDIEFTEQKATFIPSQTKSSSVIKTLLMEMNDCIQKTNIVIKAKIEPSSPSLNIICENNRIGPHQFESSSGTDMSITEIIEPYLKAETEPLVDISDTGAIEDKIAVEDKVITEEKTQKTLVDNETEPWDIENSSIGIATSNEKVKIPFEGKSQEIVVCQALNFPKTNKAADLNKVGQNNIASTLQEVLTNVSREEKPVNVLIMNVMNQGRNKVTTHQESDNSVVKEELPSNKGDEFHMSSDEFKDTKIELCNPHFTFLSNKAPKILSKKTPQRYDSHCERKIKTISYDALPTSSTIIDMCDKETTTTMGDEDKPTCLSRDSRVFRNINCCETRSMIAGDDLPLNKEEIERKALLSRLLDMTSAGLGIGYDDKDMITSSSSSLSLFFSAVQDVTNSNHQMENANKLNNVNCSVDMSSTITPDSSGSSSKKSDNSVFSKQIQRTTQALETFVQTSACNVDEDCDEFSSILSLENSNETTEMSVQDYGDESLAQNKNSEDQIVKSNDTAELLQMISNITDKSTVDQSTLPKEQIFITDSGQCNAEESDENKEQKKNTVFDSLSAEGAKHRTSEAGSWSSQGPSTCTSVEPGWKTKTWESSEPEHDYIFKNKCNVTDSLHTEHIDNSLHKCLHCWSSPQLSRTGSETIPYVSILKKSAYEQEMQEITADKSSVIPSFTVKDCIKDLMDDLTKPMVDERPFNNCLINQNTSKCSVQLQANLTTTSQIDLMDESCCIRSIESMVCKSQFEEAIEVELNDAVELELKDTAVSTEPDVKVCDEVTICRSMRPEKYVMFDDINPLNNVWLAPTNLMEAHKYEPIKRIAPNHSNSVLAKNFSLSHDDSHDMAQTLQNTSVHQPETPTKDLNAMPVTNDHIAIDVRNNKYPFIRLSYPVRSNNVYENVTPLKKPNNDFKAPGKEKDLEVGVVIVSYDKDRANGKEDNMKISNDLETTLNNNCVTPAQIKNSSPTDIRLHHSNAIHHFEPNSGDNKSWLDAVNASPISKKRRLNEQLLISNSEVDVCECSTQKVTHHCCKPYETKLSPRTEKRKSMNFSMSDNLMKGQCESPTGKSPMRKHRKGSSPEKNAQKQTRLDCDKAFIKSGSNDSNSCITSPPRDRKATEPIQAPNDFNRSPVKRKSFGYDAKNSFHSPNRGTQVNLFVCKNKSPGSLEEEKYKNLITNSDYTKETALECFPDPNSDIIHVQSTGDLSTSKGDCDNVSTGDEAQGSLPDSSYSDCKDYYQSSCCQNNTNFNVLGIGQSTIIEKINKLRFLGNRVWEWDYTGKEPWAFFLLRRRIRMIITFGQALNFSEKPIQSIVIEPAQCDSGNQLQTLCVQYAIEAMSSATSEMMTAVDLPRILLRCTGVACLAIQWLKSMWNIRTQLGCKIDGNVISFKISNPHHRLIWQVSVTILSTYHAAGIYPRAASTAVTTLVSSYKCLDEEVEQAIDSILCNWGHVPNTIWRVYRLLKNKLANEGMLCQMSTV